MKYLLLLVAFPFFSAGDCGNKKEKEKDDFVSKSDTTALPACLQKLINDAKNEEPPMTPMQVDEYLFKGKKVYLYTSPCCDFFNIVYDDSCKTICAPSGGITGKGDGKCPDFDTGAKLVRTIWKNPAFK